MPRNRRLRESEGRLGKGQGREAHPHFMISVEKAAKSIFCCQESHRDGPHESLQPQPTEPAVVSSPAWLQAQPPVFPIRPQSVPISICIFAILGHASCSSLPLWCPFQTKPLNLSPFVTLVYIWLMDGEPQEGRGSVTSCRHSLSIYYCWMYGSGQHTVSVFMKLTRHILCGVNKPNPGSGQNLFACAPGVLG